ncbi:hypothetical protein BJ508DRAFT_321515 [Ascobolus immersus RN42]|uniref:Uncharacterized protein n=1 Tax=Ascobolus immersus RN42 TaxID=1160509 RepID=A0A3N4IRV4_ASCIM|nr:hypothetical protein BJ508DRAFT_321515 [Ascobolus immersus RN42]
MARTKVICKDTPLDFIGNPVPPFIFRATRQIDCYRRKGDDGIWTFLCPLVGCDAIALEHTTMWKHLMSQAHGHADKAGDKFKPIEREQRPKPKHQAAGPAANLRKATVVKRAETVKAPLAPVSPRRAIHRQDSEAEEEGIESSPRTPSPPSPSQRTSSSPPSPARQAASPQRSSPSPPPRKPALNPPKTASSRRPQEVQATPAPTPRTDSEAPHAISQERGQSQSEEERPQEDQSEEEQPQATKRVRDDDEDPIETLKRATKRKMTEKILEAYEEGGDVDEALKDIEKISKFHLACLKMLKGVDEE